MPSKKAPKTQPVQLNESYVTLISSNEKQFIVKEEAIKCSALLTQQLQSQREQQQLNQSNDEDNPQQDETPTENNQDENSPQDNAQKPLSQMPQIHLPQIDSELLEYLVDYMNDRLTSDFMTQFTPLDQLDATKRDDRQFVVELLLAANYLQM